MRQDSDTRDQQTGSGAITPVPPGQRPTVDDDRPPAESDDQRTPSPVTDDGEGEIASDRTATDAAHDERVWDGSAEPAEGRTGPPFEDRPAEPLDDPSGEPFDDRTGESVEDRRVEPFGGRAGESVEGRAGQPFGGRAGESVEGRAGQPFGGPAGESDDDDAALEERAGAPAEDRAEGTDRDRAEAMADERAEASETEGADEERVEGHAAGEAVEDLPPVEQRSEVEPDAGQAEDIAVPEEEEPAGELKPGDAPVAAGAAALWQESEADGYRARWREVQARFLDDPRTAAEEAERLLADALESVTEVLAGRKRQLDDWRSAQRHDTEELRVTVRGYRDFLDRVLGL